MGRDLAVRCWVVTLVALAATGLHAASLHDQVEQLFKLSGDSSYASLQAARKFYDALPAKEKQDWRLEYAYTLVLMNGRQHAEAGQRLDGIVGSAPNEMSPRCARAWIHLMLGNRPAALEDLRVLANSLGRIDAAKIDEGHKRSAAFIGRAFAFLEGPAADVKNAKVKVGKAKADCQQSLKHDELLADFERGALEVSEQFRMLRVEVEAAVQEVAKQQTQQLDKKRLELAEKKTALGEEQKDLKEKTKERGDDAKKEFDRLTEKADDLEKALLTVTARAAPLRFERARAAQEIQELTTIDRANDGTERVSFVSQPRVAQLQTAVANIDAQLAVLTAEANALRARLLAVANQGRGTLAGHLSDKQKMAAEDQNLKNKDRRLEQLAKTHAKSKPTGKNAETRAMEAQLSAFSTYEPFATDEEQARLLERCK